MHTFCSSLPFHVSVPASISNPFRKCPVAVAVVWLRSSPATRHCVVGRCLARYDVIWQRWHGVAAQTPKCVRSHSWGPDSRQTFDGGQILETAMRHIKLDVINANIRNTLIWRLMLWKLCNYIWELTILTCAPFVHV